MVAGQNISILKQLNVETLVGLKSILSKLGQHLYTHVNYKGKASVGQHVRHTLEFYQCLFEADNAVNYDSRKRDIMLESSPDHAAICIDSIINRIQNVEVDFSLSLLADMPTASNQTLMVDSSLSRELLYVLEHAIHHMAIMRILIKDEAPDFTLEDSFGVAYSTLAYRNQEANG